jgi:hypothetical protein
VAGHVVVDLCEILQEKKERYLALECFYYDAVPALLVYLLATAGQAEYMCECAY